MTTTYKSSNRRSFDAPAGTFMVEQRNAGFVDNDGRWILYQLPTTRWAAGGELRITRHGRFIGVYDTEQDAEGAALNLNTTMPECDEPAIMGRVSC